jgi:predicted negative regulator of RcsB-dependent stress response
MTAPTTGGTALSPVRRDWQDWTRTNIRRVGYGAAAVVIVAGAVLAYIASERNKETFAAQALSQAWSTVESGNMALAANDLSRLVERYGGTRAADEGLILLSEIRMLTGETDAAVRDLRTFVAKRHPEYFIASGYALLGGGLENQAKFKDAAAAYRSAADAADLGFLKAQYLIDAGRAFVLAGDTASAKAALGEVLAKYNDLSQAAEARVRMGEIGGPVPPPPAPKAGSQEPQAG